MSRDLPARPSLEHLRKQAKKVLHELEKKNPEAAARFSELTAGPVPDEPKLSDAQFAVAREYGFASWPRLVAHVEAAGNAAEPVGELVAAVKMKDVAAVRRLLEQFPALKLRLNDPLPGNSFGSTVLLAARKHRELVDVLLAAGADINQRSHWWAGSFGVLDDELSPEQVDWLVARGATMDAYAAARHGRLDLLKALVARDPAVVNRKFGDGQRPLHVASSVEIAAFLLDHGAEIDALDVDHESTPAQYLLKQHTDVARYLVSRGARTDIFMAAALGDLPLVRRYLDENPDIVRAIMTWETFKMKGKRAFGPIYIWTIGLNKTPHAVAKDYGHPEVYAELMARSPEDLKLAVAAELGDETVMRELASRKDLIGSLSQAAKRRLVDAAEDENWTAVRRMLAAGWPVDATGQHGGTVLHWTAWHGNVAMIREILRYHPPLEVKDRDFGGTAVGWARHAKENGWHRDRGDYDGSVEVLLAAGTPE